MRLRLELRDRLKLMKLATWNVNSIRIRQSQVLRWIGRVEPDILLLQEIKCEEHAFPAARFSELGYRTVVVGQKAYNGVAVLSRLPFTVRHRGLPGLPPEDTQARYLEIETQGIHVCNLYVPNGNSGGEAGFAYKLQWLELLARHAQALLEADLPIVLAGDFNICPTGNDFAPGALADDDALRRPESQAGFFTLLWLGLTDAVRELWPDQTIYTFWDYQGAAWQRDLGLRIDHALLAPTLAEALVKAEPDRGVRGEAQPSDHVPVLIELAL